MDKMPIKIGSLDLTNITFTHLIKIINKRIMITLMKTLIGA
jgi:hypothetical protein